MPPQLNNKHDPSADEASHSTRLLGASDAGAMAPTAPSDRMRRFFFAWTKLPAAYLVYMAGLLISRLGDSLYTFAMPWISYELTHSALVLSSMFAVSVLPIVLFGPIVGALVDSCDRRQLMLASDAVRALLLALVPILEKLGLLQLWHLYAVTFALAVLSLLFDVAQTAAVPALADGQLVRANASTQLVTQLTAIAGPALAGAVVAGFGGYTALWLNAISFGATWLAIYRMPPFGGKRTGAFRLSALFADMKDGLRWLARDRLNASLSLQAMAGNFGYSAASSVLMFFLLSDLGLSASQTSITYSLIGVGGLLGALLIVPLAKRYRQGVLIAVLLAIGSAGFFLPLLSRGWLMPGLAFAIVSVCNVGWNTMVLSMRQRTVPPDKLGRVLGFSRTITRLAMPLGAAVGGVCIRAFRTVSRLPRSRRSKACRSCHCAAIPHSPHVKSSQSAHPHMYPQIQAKPRQTRGFLRRLNVNESVPIWKEPPNPL